MLVSSTMLRRIAQALTSASHTSDSDFPTNAVLSKMGCPGKGVSLYAGFSHLETGLRQAAEETAEPTLISQRLLCFPRGFQLGANRTTLLSSARLGLPFFRGREEEQRESWCLVGLAFPRSKTAPGVHLAKPT